MTRKTIFWLIGLLLAVIFACSLGFGLGHALGGAGSRSSQTASLPPAPTLAPPTPRPTATPWPTPQSLPIAQAATDSFEQRLVQIYQQDSPAVVNVNTQILRNDFFWGVTPTSGSGSGFVWDEQGHIVTNYHVVEDAHSIEVSFGKDNAAPAQVVGVDPANDLAVIQVNALPDGIRPIPKGDSNALQVGQIVAVIGNPFGHFQRTMTSGIISALDRTIRDKNQRVLRRMIQTDADINHGNSGGPLLDSQGRIIGIISAIYSPTGANAGVGLAIPINKAKRVIPILIEKGRFPHPWLGVEHLGYEISPDLAKALALPVDHGLLVAQIYDNSPAQRAGIRPAASEVIVGNQRYLTGGDIITAIDGAPLNTWEDMDAYLQENAEVGQTVTLDIFREGQTQQIQVQLDAEP